MKFLVLNGPNLNLLGQREPGIYGEQTYDGLCRQLTAFAEAHGSTVDFVQSNYEGALIDAIHGAPGKYDAMVMNPGAFTHYSIALLDALKAVNVPCIEVHISNIRDGGSLRGADLRAGLLWIPRRYGLFPDPGRQLKPEPNTHLLWKMRVYVSVWRGAIGQDKMPKNKEKK